MTLDYTSQPAEYHSFCVSLVLKTSRKQAASIQNIRKKPTSIHRDGQKGPICHVLLPVTNILARQYLAFYKCSPGHQIQE